MDWRSLSSALRELEAKYGRMVIWLDDPLKYEYLRVGRITKCTRTPPPIKSWASRSKDFFKLVGFMWPPAKRGDRLYVITFFWLKRHDRGCPDEEIGYGSEPEWIRPAESELVTAIMSRIREEGIHQVYLV